MPRRMVPREVHRGIIYKRCSKCGDYIPQSEFHIETGNEIDGLQNYCKNCKHIYYLARKQERLD